MESLRVEYNKDKYVEKAEPASSSSLFPAWTEPGTVFYKVRKEVLAPTRIVRARSQCAMSVSARLQANTLLRIDGFYEDFRHTVVTWNSKRFRIKSRASS